MSERESKVNSYVINLSYMTVVRHIAGLCVSLVFCSQIPKNVCLILLLEFQLVALRRQVQEEGYLRLRIPLRSTIPAYVVNDPYS